MTVAVRTVGIWKAFTGHEVLKGIDLEVSYGEVLCILGPSGSGKATLLRCINHLEVPDGGYAWVDGQIIGYELWGRTLHELPVRRPWCTIRLRPLELQLRCLKFAQKDRKVLS